MAYLPGQQYVQSATGVWTPVGYAAGNLTVPVNLSTSTGNVPAVTGVLSAAVADNPGTATTASTAGQVIANVMASGNATFHLVTSAFVGSVIFEGSINGGLNYFPLYCMREDGSAGETGASLNAIAAFIRAYTTGLPGMTHLRVRAPTFVSGTLSVIINQGPFLIEPTPSLGASAAVIGAVSQVDGPKATYSGSIASLAAGATDIFVLLGSASKVVRITRLSISGTQTTAGQTTISLIKRSANDTGGTGVAVVATPHDSAAVPATAVAQGYTVAPTALGSIVGIIRSSKLFVSSTAVAGALLIWDFGTHPGAQHVVLRGAAQTFAVNVSAALAGASYAIDVEWTEE